MSQVLTLKDLRRAAAALREGWGQAVVDLNGVPSYVCSLPEGLAQAAMEAGLAPFCPTPQGEPLRIHYVHMLIPTGEP